MNHYRAMVLNPNTSLEKELHQGEQLVILDMQTAGSVEQLSQEVTKGKVDIVLLYETPELTGLELLHQVRKHQPSIPAILLVSPASGAWSQTMNDPRTELVSNPVPPIELQHRIAKLLTQVERASRAVPAGQSITNAVTELRNPRSGKLDASLVADAFGISLADVARAIDKKLQTIHQTPDSDGLQKLLYPYERIASAIKYTTGSLQPALKIWLNAHNQTMPNTLPVELVKKGHADQLADLWDDTLLGHPD
jgi:CheY-like chemotaxis protein